MSDFNEVPFPQHPFMLYDTFVISEYFGLGFGTIALNWDKPVREVIRNHKSEKSLLETHYGKSCIGRDKNLVIVNWQVALFCPARAEIFQAALAYTPDLAAFADPKLIYSALASAGFTATEISFHLTNQK